MLLPRMLSIVPSTQATDLWQIFQHQPEVEVLEILVVGFPAVKEYALAWALGLGKAVTEVGEVPPLLLLVSSTAAALEEVLFG